MPLNSALARSRRLRVLLARRGLSIVTGYHGVLVLGLLGGPGMCTHDFTDYEDWIWDMSLRASGVY